MTSADIALLLALAVCCVTDIRRRRIPNWVTYPAVLCALAASTAVWLSGVFGDPEIAGAVAVRVGLPDPLFVLAGFGACFGVMLLVYASAGGGAGDVKIAAAIGSLMGAQRGLTALLVAYIVAGTVILAWYVWTAGPLRIFGMLFRAAAAAAAPRHVAPPPAPDRSLLQAPISMAPFYTAGAVAVMFHEELAWW